MEKTKQPARDEKGVRINNYTERTHGRYKSEKGTPEQTRVLLDTFRRNFLQEIPGTGEGDVIQQRTGRPPKYATVESFVDKVNEYMQYISDTFDNTGVELIPDVEGFCAFAGISRDTLNQWELNRPPEFSDVIKCLKTSIASYKKQLGMQGRIPPIVLALDFNNNHGYIQQQSIDIRTNNRVDELPTAADIVKKLPSSTGEDADIDI